ncbi:MAG: MFS transporter [Rhodospirillales bacterium]|nr:MFS transporter [Rhodospirillales bacterium]
MGILFLVVFVDLVGFGVIIPLLPFYGEHFHASPSQVGLLMAIYSFGQFLAAPIWGQLSDRIGRKPVLVISLIGATLSYLWLANATSLWMLFAARAVGGVMAGNIGTAFAYVADITTPANRAKGMGVVGAAFGLGFIFGPAIGGILAGNDPAHADYVSPALTAAALSGIATLLAIFLLKESLSAETRRAHAALPRSSRWRLLATALRTPVVGRLIVIAFLSTFVFAGMETTFAMWSRRAFGWGPEQNGYIFAFVGFTSALVQGGGVGRLAKRFGERALVIGGAAALAAGMLAIPLSTTIPVLAAAMLIVALGFSLMTPSLNSLVSLAVEKSVQGGTMGVSRSATTLARVLGPSWAGLLFEHAGRDWPFLAGAVLMSGVVLIALGSTAARPACEGGDVRGADAP